LKFIRTSLRISECSANICFDFEIHMRQRKFKIAYLNINRFNPFLCDGVSVSTLELLQFLNNQGHEAAIFTYLTSEPYKQNIFNWAIRQFAPQLKGKDLKSFSYMTDSILINQELLPFHQSELPENKNFILETMIQKLTKAEITHLITVEDDFLSLLAGAILGIPGSHFFHSPAYLSSYRESPFFSKVLKKRNLFAGSRFLQRKIKKEIGLAADLWYPLIDLGKYKLKIKWIPQKTAGYYSAGRHKGDEIINRLVADLPDWSFTVIGRHYSHRFEHVPKNLHLWGDNPDFKRFYESIGILLVPSIEDEGFSRVILEAAANGIPAIANSLGGIPEALGDSGILVDTGASVSEHPDIDEIVAVYRRSILRINSDLLFYRGLHQKAFNRARAYEKKEAALSMKNMKKMFAG
jgi:glycosyltransferase involved in cell wall biosynthesis